MLCLVYTRADGGTSIVRAAPGYRLVASYGDETFDPPVPAETIRHDAEWLKTAAREGRLIWAETNEDFIARVAGRSVPKDAIDVRIADEDEVPADRTFRNALQNDLTHDMGKARDIWRDKLREERAPLLAALDVEYMRADETGDLAAKTAIAKQKQALRDVTADPAIDAAKTPQELKAVRPTAIDVEVAAEAGALAVVSR